MVFIFASDRCNSCKKAKTWLNLHQIKYQEKKLNTSQFKISDIDLILGYENIDFNKILSIRSNFFKKQKINLFSMSVAQIKQIIFQNPNILKKPIICDEKFIIIGYNKDDIRIFLLKMLRKYIIQKNINLRYNKDYNSAIKEYFEKIGNNNNF
ncbi:regulatory protein spx [Candidatus Phytoplasma luffae]|uniref:Regulatory protein spx n=1 Tax=Loofah witches'-broom phytoplasma TaxID=35773 RepID=A0A975FIW5_LOWBP|nr:ArsC/Spx/MgsR family protein [Candidatus Phytoplasma luffae]QTX02754.1 regulatory protein spx [Candidatus Phytoplasma luffae]